MKLAAPELIHSGVFVNRSLTPRSRKRVDVGGAADCAGGSAGGDDAAVGVVHCFDDVWVVDVAFVPHGGGEVSGGDKEDVDVVDSEDFVEVFVGDDVFEEDDQEGVVVGYVHEVGVHRGLVGWCSCLALPIGGNLPPSTTFWASAASLT